MMRKFLKGHGRFLRAMITDKHRSNGAAKRDIIPASGIVRTRVRTIGQEFLSTHPAFSAYVREPGLAEFL